MQKKFTIWVAAGAVLAAWIVIAGCGGGGVAGIPFNDPSATPSDNVSTANATFVGADTAPACSLCHATIVADYALQAHGEDFHDVNGSDLITGYGGGCAACHTVGFDEPTGYNADPANLNVALEQIQCEECHGPASIHNASAAGINGIPDAAETCWDCHGTSYKQMDSSPGPTVDADLEGRNPGSVSVHHPQTPMLAGVYGYEYAGSTYTDSQHTEIANTCVTCHLYVAAGDTADHGADALHPDDEACASCHRNAAALATLHEETEADIIGHLVELGGEDPLVPGEPDHDVGGGLLAAWAEANAIALDTNDNPTDAAVRAYKAARHNYTFVLADASHGVHNYNYTHQLLEDSIASLTTS